MVQGKSLWFKILIEVLFTALGIILLWWQAGLGLFSFMNAWSARIFSVFCIFIIALGIGLAQDGAPAQLKWTLVSFIMILFPLIAFGGYLFVNDAMMGTTITEGAGAWYALDALGGMGSTVAIIQSVVQLVPYAVLVIGVVQIFVAGDMDGYFKAFIEIAVSIAALVIFYYFGSYFGFS